MGLAHMRYYHRSFSDAIRRAMKIDELRIRYGDDAFNKAVEMCRTTELDIMDCLEICNNDKRSCV